MAINIGNEATEAVQELRNHPWFVRLLDGLGKLAYERVNAAIAAPPELRVEQTSYARALFDVWAGMSAAYNGESTVRAKPAPPVKLRQGASPTNAA